MIPLGLRLVLVTTWNSRHGWFWTGTSSVPPIPAAAGTAPLWWHPGGDTFDGQATAPLAPTLRSVSVPTILSQALTWSPSWMRARSKFGNWLREGRMLRHLQRSCPCDLRTLERAYHVRLGRPDDAVPGTHTVSRSTCRMYTLNVFSQV